MKALHFPGRSAVRGQECMVATAHPAASAAAFGILRSGGSAFDAAICAAAFLAVVERQASGVGGDSFVLGYGVAKGKTLGLNGSGKSAGTMTADDLRALGYTGIPLLRRGHSVRVAHLPIGGAQAIGIDPQRGTLAVRTPARTVWRSACNR